MSRPSTDSCPSTSVWDCTPPRPPVRGDNARTVAQWFGLAPGPWKPYHRRKSKQPRPEAPAPPRFALDTPPPGTITLVTGPSGAGKSTLLRQWLHAHASSDSAGPRPCVIDLNTLPLPDAPLVDLFPNLTLKNALALLGRAGLGEVWTYLRTPAELSDGQRWRLRLALAVHASTQHPSAVIICDEFTAVLDRITAAVVARGLRRLIDQHANRLSALLATAHDDLHNALCPDLTVQTDFTRVTLHTKP